MWVRVGRDGAKRSLCSRPTTEIDSERDTGRDKETEHNITDRERLGEKHM